MNKEHTQLRKVLAIVRNLAKTYPGLDPDDLAQAVVIKLLKGAWLPQGASVSWLSVVVLNTARDLYKKRSREERYVDRSVTLDISGQATVVAENDESVSVPCVWDACGFIRGNTEGAQDLQSAIDKLPEQQRIAFMLFADGASYVDIAKNTGAKVGTVRSRLHHARRALRSRLAYLA